MYVMLCNIYELAHNTQQSKFSLGAHGSKGVAASFSCPYSFSETPESLINCRLLKQSEPKVAADDGEIVYRK